MKYKYKNSIKKFSVTLLSVLAVGSMIGESQAANWLMLQGTEKSDAAPRAKVWGFIQAQYQKDYSKPFNDAFAPPKLIGPNLTNQEQFNVNRARIGVRGIAMPLDSNVNYFFLAEFGNNAITAGNNGSTNVTDASITLNHIKGARVRVGLFKIPIAEEALQAIHVFDYINFTAVSNQMLLERFALNGDGNQAATTTPNITTLNKFSRPVGAFRDVGIQVFDTFKSGHWENSYAIMYGNGNGLNFGDIDDNKDLYLYYSSEQVYKGKGGRRESLKMFAWTVSGKRTNMVNGIDTQERTRSGIGVKYLKKPYRVTAEYMTGKGMIFQGPHRPLHIYNDKKASGYYLDFGWYIPNSKFELDLRFDNYVREENHPSSGSDDKTTFDTVTIGTQYHFNKKSRLNIEYSSRKNKSDTVAIDNQNKDVSGRFAIQVTSIF